MTTLKDATRHLRYWQRKVDELSAGVNVNVNVNAKDKEEGREEIPPTPPKGESEEEKENHTHTPRARERPTLEQALNWAIAKLGVTKVPREAVEDWHAQCEMADWKTKDGNPIHNWGRDLCLHIRYWNKLKHEREPHAGEQRRGKSADPTKIVIPATKSLSRMDYSKYA